MASRFDSLPARESLAAIAKDFHHRGWMAGTAGNLSSRSAETEDSFWITASGQPKGQLVKTDFLLIGIEHGTTIQRFETSATPSAETCIHQTIYQLFPEANACFHIHSVDACLATERHPLNALEMPLPPLEILKGLGIWKQDPCVDLPLFDNLLDVAAIASDIKHRFKHCPPPVPALMIRDHGITVWGESLQQAYNQVEIVEFLMSYLARRH